MPASDSTPKLTPSEFAALKHHVNYGVSPAPPPERVVPREWNPPKGFSSPILAKWDIYVPAKSVERLKLGCQPRDMDEKWFVWAEDVPASAASAENEGEEKEEGKEKEKEKLIVRFYRSWTGFLIYELHIEILKDGEMKKRFRVEKNGWGDKMETAKVEYGEEEDVGGRVTRFVWESDEEKIRGQSEESSKDGCRGVCRWVLGASLGEEEVA